MLSAKVFYQKSLCSMGIAHVHNPFYKHRLTPTKECKEIMEP